MAQLECKRFRRGGDETKTGHKVGKAGILLPSRDSPSANQSATRAGVQSLTMRSLSPWLTQSLCFQVTFIRHASKGEVNCFIYATTNIRADGSDIQYRYLDIYSGNFNVSFYSFILK